MAIGTVYRGSSFRLPSMVSLMEGPLLAVARIVSNMLVNVANETMSACSLQADAICTCGVSTIPYGIVGSESLTLVVAVWERAATWLDISMWIALVAFGMLVNIANETMSACPL